jgi:hypothetical protein
MNSEQWKTSFIVHFYLFIVHLLSVFNRHNKGGYGTGTVRLGGKGGFRFTV